MLVKCEIPDALAGVVSPLGPVDCAPAGFRRVAGEWKHSLGGVAVLAVALFLLFLLADEAMDGGMLVALLTSLGRV